ncbi:MAG: ATP-grasp domain-containing protein [bacterium]|nr:ATP-grasp domain-containing protein [bacterium]
MRSVIGVLRGGPSSEYDISLKSGATVLEHLDKEKYEPRDLFISKDGQWHLHGAPVTPERALRGIDVAFNMIHGQYGEDGELQRILEAIGVSHTGPGAAAAALAFDKQATKDLVVGHGIKVAHGAVIDSGKITDLQKTAFNIFRSMPHPLIVKPVVGGSSVGISKVDNFNALEFALNRAFAISPRALVEEFIAGKEATVGVIDNFRNEKCYALMPVEIIPPPSAQFFDYDTKYSGQTIERVPGNFSKEEKSELMRLARTVHEALALPHYSRSDFIVSKRGIYFLEVNPASGIGFTKESVFPKALHAVGATISQFLDHIIALTKRKHVRN